MLTLLAGCALALHVGHPVRTTTAVGPARFTAPAMLHEKPAVGRREALFAAVSLLSVSVPFAASAAVMTEAEIARAKATREREAAAKTRAREKAAKEDLRLAEIKKAAKEKAADKVAKEKAKVQAAQAAKEKAKVNKAQKVKAQAIKGVRPKKQSGGGFLSSLGNLLVAGVVGVGVLAAQDAPKDDSDNSAA